MQQPNSKFVNLSNILPKLNINIIHNKKDDFCQRHQLYFDNEQHLLPSGREMWIGCPKCYRNDKMFRQKKDFAMFMKDIGMGYNPDKDEFFKPEEPGGQREDQKSDKINLKTYAKNLKGHDNYDY